MALLDEYATEGDALPRALQTFVGNATNSTPPVPVVEPEYDSKIPWVPLALVGLGGAGVAGYFMMQSGHTYETYDYDHAAESGLLEDPDYEVEYDDGEYDE